MNGHDPLAQFLALCQALREDHSWSQDWTIVRQAALVLCGSSGDPRALASQTRTNAADLRKRANWFGPLRGDARFLVGALLLRQQDPVPSFWSEVERVRKLLRGAKISLVGRGSLAETLAILLLRQATPDRHVSNSQVARFAAIYRMFRHEHPFLTGSEDYPACAMLCASVHATSELQRLVEGSYKELRSRRYRAGNHLQTASHILALGVGDPQRSAERFDRIWHGFQGQALRMRADDYDEVALLAALEEPADSIVRVVLQHRAQIEQLKPRPRRADSFQLAVSTAFMALSQRQHHAQVLGDLKAIASVLETLARKQQAAAAAS